MSRTHNSLTIPKGSRLLVVVSPQQPCSMVRLGWDTEQLCLCHRLHASNECAATQCQWFCCHRSPGCRFWGLLPSLIQARGCPSAMPHDAGLALGDFLSCSLVSWHHAWLRHLWHAWLRHLCTQHPLCVERRSWVLVTGPLCRSGQHEVRIPAGAVGRPVCLTHDWLSKSVLAQLSAAVRPQLGNQHP